MGTSSLNQPFLSGLFETSSLASHIPAPVHPWRTGFWRRFPWLGILALFGAVLCAAAMVGILVASDNKPVDHWNIQPTVYLSIASTAANILLQFALTEGTTIFWWVRALQGETTVKNLHDYWDHGRHLAPALFAGKSINLAAFACIAVAITPLNGPLIQRASVVGSLHMTRETTVRVPIAPVLPDGFTGLITGRGHQTAMPNSNISALVKAYNAKLPVNITESLCEGNCVATLQGAGFSINCAALATPFDVTPRLFDNGTVDPSSFDTTYIFQTNFTYWEMEQGMMNLTTLYKATTSCNGDLMIDQCTLMPAIMEYHVIIVNNTVALDPAYTYKDDKLIKLTPAFVNTFTGPTTYGGLWLILNSMIESSASMNFAGAVGYDVVSSGLPAFEYANGTHALDTQNCTSNWNSPTDDMLATVRDMLFRTALLAANSSTIQTVKALQTDPMTVFKSHYQFLGLALLVTFLGIFCVIPTFLGWWNLGRAVSLSPVETAKAFSAPMLYSSDSNATADQLLRDVGGRRVRYGAVAVVDGRAIGHSELVPYGAEVRQKLEMADPGWISKPNNGALFDG
ncbi:hypothetical protein AOQ84DRAFT_355343 [Glonium stellatum]|uniref:Uncharacterized protein n=1 Tax=Glonium stellatum TaxID=574774 RepID=A0A8E2EXI9_9PEZI|nr:hypothetical protein AOQ84DRAFT_355343 [Glonium stellatum]